MFPFTDDGEMFPLRKEIDFTGQVWKPTDPALKWGGAQWLGISWAWQVLWRVMWWRGFWSFWDLPRYVCCIKIGLTFFIFWLFIWAEVIVWDDYYLLVFMHCVSSTFVWFTLVNPQLQVFEMIHSLLLLHLHIWSWPSVCEFEIHYPPQKYHHSYYWTSWSNWSPVTPWSSWSPW